MFSDDLIARLAAELHAAEKAGVQVEHFSKRYPGMTIADGYAISRAWVRMKLAEGRTVLLVTHRTELAARCDRVVELRDGRIAAAGECAAAEVAA